MHLLAAPVMGLERPLHRVIVLRRGAVGLAGGVGLFLPGAIAVRFRRQRTLDSRVTDVKQYDGPETPGSRTLAAVSDRLLAAHRPRAPSPDWTAFRIVRNRGVAAGPRPGPPECVAV